MSTMIQHNQEKLHRSLTKSVTMGRTLRSSQNQTGIPSALLNVASMLGWTTLSGGSASRMSQRRRQKALTSIMFTQLEAELKPRESLASIRLPLGLMILSSSPQSPFSMMMTVRGIHLGSISTPTLVSMAPSTPLIVC